MKVDICTLFLTSIISIGDFIKLGIEIKYISEDEPGSSYVLWHLLVYILILFCRYLYEQMEVLFTRDRSHQFRIIHIISILFYIEVGLIVALGFMTQIYTKSFMLIGCILSSLINAMYLHHYLFYRIRHNQIHPIQATIPTQYPLTCHICEPECYYCPCMICLETIDYLVEMPCKHSIHHSCFVSWKQRKNTCPLCRSII
jgi:hypothetical protein